MVFRHMGGGVVRSCLVHHLGSEDRSDIIQKGLERRPPILEVRVTHHHSTDRGQPRQPPVPPRQYSVRI